MPTRNGVCGFSGCNRTDRRYGRHMKNYHGGTKRNKVNACVNPPSQTHTERDAFKGNENNESDKHNNSLNPNEIPTTLTPHEGETSKHTNNTPLHPHSPYHNASPLNRGGGLRHLRVQQAEKRRNKSQR